MADPLSIGVSVLAVVTAALKSTKSLSATVKRFKERDKTLARLQDELEDLINVLSSLKDAANADTPILAVLKGPVDRCSQVCHEFEEAMEKFGRKSKTGLRDWARMEFARGDINGLMDTLASYKSTIMVGLGTIAMHHSKLTHQALEDYNEMIKDTAYDLEIRLQRIEASITVEGATGFDTTVDLQNEREVTRQCLRICQDAQSYIESLQDRQPFSRQEATPRPTDTVVLDQFAAELLTSQTLNKNRDNIIQTINRLQERLASITSGEGPERDRQIARLQDDVNISKQCLEICREASDQVVQHRKIHTVGEVIADDDTDQVVVTTLADLFDVRKVLAKSRSTQLVGSMMDQTLQSVSRDRYNSRFGTMAGDPVHANPGIRENSTPARRPNPTTKDKQPANAETRHDRPSPNVVRKRTPEGDSGTRPKVDE